VVSFLQVSPTKTLYTPLLSPVRTTCPAHLILLDFITQTTLGEEYRSLSSSLCSFLYSPVTSSLLGPNILLSTLFSNTLSLCSFLNVSDQVKHPYKTRGKIIVLYIQSLNFRIANWKSKLHTVTVISYAIWNVLDETVSLNTCYRYMHQKSICLNVAI